MKETLKKLINLAVVSLVPLLIEMAVDYLNELKKKIQDKNEEEKKTSPN